jgi:hypothetical protein
MKKILFFLSLILLNSSQLFAQKKYLLTQLTSKSFISFRNMNDINGVQGKNYLSTNYSPDKDAEFYKHRSKNYRIVGWSTLGAGVVLSGIGVLLANGDYATTHANSNTAGVLTIAGAASGIVSIPFMIMASVNKQKARAMVESQKTGFGVPSNVSSYITGITVSIPLGN